MDVLVVWGQKEIRALHSEFYRHFKSYVHLLVYDTGNGNEAIPKSIQLIAGKTGQEFNNRKGRNGAFWQDRYHATAVATDDHLIRCMVYIDLNMVRAGVVKHPRDWPFGGYRYIVAPPQRYQLTDNKKLMELTNISEIDRFCETYRNWVDATIVRQLPIQFCAKCAKYFAPSL